MSWNFINTINLVITVVLLIPDLIHLIRNKKKGLIAKIPPISLAVCLMRFVCSALMLICVTDFGFKFASTNLFVAYLFLVLIAAIAYYLIYMFNLLHKNILFLMALGIILSALYIVGGALLSYWPLIAAGVVYLVLKVICIHKVKRAV